MTDFVAGQSVGLLKALAAGAVLAAAYDVIRILRMTVRHRIYLISAEDLVFWSISSVAVFFFILFENDGKFRMYMAAGMIAGAMIYNMTVGRLLMKMVGKIIQKTKKIFRKLLKKNRIKPKMKKSSVN